MPDVTAIIRDGDGYERDAGAGDVLALPGLAVAGELLGGSGFAALIGYDNTASELAAEDVQAAIDELAAREAGGMENPYTPEGGTWTVTGGVSLSGALGVGGNATVSGALLLPGGTSTTGIDIGSAAGTTSPRLREDSGSLDIVFSTSGMRRLRVLNGSGLATIRVACSEVAIVDVETFGSTTSGTFLGQPRARSVAIKRRNNPVVDSPMVISNQSGGLFFGTTDTLALTLDGTTQRATMHAGATSGASVRVPVPVSSFTAGGSGPSYAAATSGPRWILGTSGVVYASLGLLPGAVVTGFRVSWSAGADPSEIAVALCRAAFGSTTRTVVASGSVSDNTGDHDDALAITAHTVAEGYAYWLEVSQVGAGGVTLRGCDLVTSSRDY